MMGCIGLSIQEALDIVVVALEKRDIKDKLKIIASDKVLTSDDVVELFTYGANFINIARGL